MAFDKPKLNNSHTGLPPPSESELLDIHSNESHTFKHHGLVTHPNIQPRCRLLMFFNKKEGISDTKFHTWWETIHADLTVSTTKFPVYIRRYAQLHSTPAQKKEASILISPDGLGNGTKLLDFDACGELMVDKLEDWAKFTSDPEFLSELLRTYILFVFAIFDLLRLFLVSTN